MKYYSTNKKAPIADLHKAVVKGLAEDRGLYMPEIIKKLPQDFFDNIEKLSFQEIAYKVADAFFGEDVDAESLKKIVYDTLAFDCPVVEVEPNIYSLELFHILPSPSRMWVRASWPVSCNTSYVRRARKK